MINIKIEYVDGEIIECLPEEWSSVRAEGIYEIKISNTRTTISRTTIYSGHSLYWFYKEHDYWVLGCASTYQVDITPETIFLDNKQIVRKIEFIPDLLHKDIKLGWWKNNMKNNKFKVRSDREFKLP